MVFSKEDKILIKSLRESKGYSARKFINNICQSYSKNKSGPLYILNVSFIVCYNKNSKSLETYAVILG